MVTAAPDLIPPPLINQLKAGGRMVIPVGLAGAQQLVVVERDLNGKVTTKEIMPVVLGARGVRSACIPGILISRSPNRMLASAPVFRIN
jgi:protein-L-isoaspartate(D-aspartate) O-methyltransferase (PCMT)